MHALAKNGGTLHIIYLFSKGNQHSPLLPMSQKVCLFVTGSMVCTVLHMATIKSHFPCNASELSWELCFWMCVVFACLSDIDPYRFRIEYSCTNNSPIHLQVGNVFFFFFCCCFHLNLICAVFSRLQRVKMPQR